MEPKPLQFMSLKDIPTGRNGDVYVGVLEDVDFRRGDDVGETFIFEERSPLDSLKATCFFSQLWPTNITAEGIFWVNSQPDICFKLRIEKGLPITRPAGKWFAARQQYGLPQPDLFKCLTGRAWDINYGDRIQKLVFRNTGDFQPYIEDVLTRCLTSADVNEFISSG